MSSVGQRGCGVSAEPSALLVRFAGLLPRHGPALDVACGYRQNTLFLARQGLSALGVDRSWKALSAGREAAVRSELNATYVLADLTLFAIPADTFSAVICFKYRDPNLYPSLRMALLPGGLVIYETYTREHAKYGLKPCNPAHLLERNELLRAFGDWEIIYYREIWAGRGVASLVTRKPLSALEC